MNDVVIRPLAGAAEARFCADFMAASEPWLTLGLTQARIFNSLMGSSREAHVATVGNQILGVLILHLAGPLNGYIQTLAVPPEWRGGGTGGQMMDFAEPRIFQQSPNVFLCVSSFNHRAQNFYERRGYLRVGELPDYLAKGFSEILMRKTHGPWLAFSAES